MKRNLAIVIGCLFAVWLISVAVLLLFLADLAGVPALVGAIVAQIGVAVTGAGILITTNTRAWASNDPYAATTAELLRPPLLRDDERRVRAGTIDDRNVVQRLSDILEEEADRRKPGETPAWVIDVNRTHTRADDAFPDPPREDS